MVANRAPGKNPYPLKGYGFIGGYYNPGPAPARGLPASLNTNNITHNVRAGHGRGTISVVYANKIGSHTG
jgi:hypothetical protein